MARGDFKQRVVLELEDQASSGVAKVQGKFAKLGSFLASKFTITLGDVVAVFKTLTGAVGDVIGAAQIQEDAVKRLDQSLSSLGPTAATASEALQAQAAALELTTRFSDEAIIANQALALNLGVSAGDMAKLTEAAVELSAATGRSLESSFVNLGRTLNGFKGELGELVPEVARMSVENLKAGAALDVILDRLGGTAAGDVKTFSGLIAQLGNAWGTVKEKLGEAITQNEGITQALAKLRDLITSPEFISAIVGIADGFANITVWFVETIAASGRLIDKLKSIGTRIVDLRRKVLDFLGPLGTLIEWLGGKLLSGLKAVNPALGLAFDAVNSLGTASGEAAAKIGEMADNTAAAVPKIESYKDVNVGAGAAIKERAAQERDAISTTAVLKAVTDDSINAVTAYAQVERELAAEVEKTNQKLSERAGASGGTTGGSVGGVYARDPRQQADVDAALAAGNQPYFGGTRIRTADGTGSRLLR